MSDARSGLDETGDTNTPSAPKFAANARVYLSVALHSSLASRELPLDEIETGPERDASAGQTTELDAAMSPTPSGVGEPAAATTQQVMHSAFSPGAASPVPEYATGDDNEASASGIAAETGLLADFTTEPVSFHAHVWQLNEAWGSSEDHLTGWSRLHARFTAGRGDNLRPWFRCLGVLKGLKARTVIVETYYVCLDYKSEFATFYAHLDAPIHGWAVRLHFFAERVEAGDLVKLTKTQRKSYLGYMVCREGNLPLVGRTLLKLPDYVASGENSAITENVNLFGQRLRVRGVPFMQQDQRFANCAHVALWTMGYTAYRRGTSERRLIADVVEMMGASHALRPRKSADLAPEHVAAALTEWGFRATDYQTPNRESSVQSLPAVQWVELPGTLSELFGDELKLPRNPPSRDLTLSVARRFNDYVQLAADADDLLQDDTTAPGRGTIDAGSPAGPDSTIGHDNAADLDYEDYETETVETTFDTEHASVRAMHRLLDYLTAPYLRSGWPIYLGTDDHALILCGRFGPEAQPLHVIHDDQIGPYLVTESLPTISKDGLHFQSGQPKALGKAEQETEPDPDRVAEALRKGGTGVAGIRTKDHGHAVYNMVVAVPPRVLLPTNKATLLARQVVIDFIGGVNELDLEDAAASELAQATSTSALIMMGIDYKLARRKSTRQARDEAGMTVFSAVQLSEWVVVVEGAHSKPEGQGRSVVWECVFDASSSEDAPRLLLARIRTVVVTAFPRDDTAVESTEIQLAHMPPLTIPDRVGKVRT